MAKRKLEVVIDGVNKGLRSALTGAASDIDRFEAKTSRVGEALKRLGKYAGVAFVSGLATAGAATVKFGADFEKAMTSSLAIMGGVSDEMRTQMETAAREVAKTTTFSAEQAAESYYFLASAGMMAEQSIAALPGVAAFAQAGMFDMAQATDLLTDAQSALGLTVDDASKNLENQTRISDVLVKANTLANASVEQLSSALTNKAGTAAKILGKDVEETTAVLAAFADQGVKGEEAGEKLNIVWRDLQKASIENAAAFEAHGIAVYDANGEMRHTADIIGDLENAFAGMSDEEKKTTLATLGFQERSQAAMLTLFGTSDAIREYDSALHDAGGTTEEVAEKQLQNFWSQLGLVKDRLIDVGLTIWENLGPTMSDTIMGAVGELEPIFLTLGETIGDVFEQFGPVLQDVLTRFGSLLGEVLGKVAESGILEDLAEIASILADNILGAAEDLLPITVELLNVFLDIVTPVTQFADSMGLIEGAVYGIVASKIAITLARMTAHFSSMAGFSARAALSMGVMVGKIGLVGAGIAAAIPFVQKLAEDIECTNKNLETMAEGMDELVAKWDEMGEAARRSTIDQLNVELEKVKALCGENSEEAQNLSNYILELNRGFDSSIEVMREWNDRFSDDMVDAAVVGSSAFDQLLTDAEQFGKDMAEGTNNLHVEIIGQYKSQNEKLHLLAVEGAKGFVEGKMEGWRDVGPETMESIKGQLFDIIANPEDYKNMGADDIHTLLMSMADAHQVNRQKLIEIEDDILAILGLGDQAGAVGATAITNWGESFSQTYWNDVRANVLIPIMQDMLHLFNITFRPHISPTKGGGEPDIAGTGYHTGGLVMHEGGWVKAHAGILAHDEVHAILKRKEFVMQESAVEKHGVDFMQAVNAGKLPSSQTFTITGNTFILDNVREPRDFLPELSQLLGQEIMTYKQVHGL